MKTIIPPCPAVFLSLVLAAPLLVAADIPAAPAHEEAHPASVPLWPNGAPGSEARKDEPERVDWRQEPDIVFPVTYNIHNPSLTPFLPAPEKATGAAVIIAPGGGHMFLTTDREGYDLARWLADRGVAAFVLKYRLAKDHAGNSPYTVEGSALPDAQRAIRTVRARKTEWGVDPTRVGILGFSAGGEVAALAETRYDDGRPDAADLVERLSSRPDFAVLIYPGLDAVVAKGGLTVDSRTPPTFMACAYDDRPSMSENLAKLYIQLHQAGVNAELHIYSTGGHGFGVRERALAVTGWTSRMLEWMGDRGLLSGSQGASR